MHDIHRFPHLLGETSGRDADVGFTVAYLANELTPGETLAFEKRFAADSAFRDVAQPIMDAWFVPRTLQPVAVHARETVRKHRITSVARIAAAIAILVIPMLTVTKAVAFAAAHPSAPGHAIARQIVATLSLVGPTRVVPVSAQLPVVTVVGKARDSIPRTRKVGARVALSIDTFPSLHSGPVRVLSDGRLFVVDRDRHLVRLYDASLTRATDIPVPSNRWEGPVTVSAFQGDSTLLITNSGSVLVDVLDPSGRVSRTIPWGERTLTMPVSSGSAIVANSGVVVGSIPRGVFVSPTGFWSYRLNRTTGPNNWVDTSLVIRSPLGSFHVDTVTIAERLVEPRMTPSQWTDSLGVRFNIDSTRPRLESDAVVPMMDGTIAVIRKSDYHIDWIDADGSRRSTGAVPHEWRKLNERDWALIAADAQATITQFAMAGQHTENGNRTYRVVPFVVSVNTSVERQPAFVTSLFPMNYKPLADTEGNLWIPQSPPPGSGGTPAVVFDIVNRQGKLVDRVEMPPAMVPVGFAPGRVVAMEWLGAAPGCPHPTPGTGAMAVEECMRHPGRLATFRIH